jgi:hypothetical protein
MPKVERNVVKPANEPGRRGARAENSFLPLVGGPPAVHPSNESGAKGDRLGGSANLAERASPVKLPDHRFRLDDAQMPQPGAAVEPGRGAVPVNPFVPGGAGINRAFPVADSAKPAR